jgi:lysophospholipase L1-like esterase
MRYAQAVLEFDPLRESRRLLREIPWSRFVAIGDSTVEGTLSDPYPPYPDRCWAQLIADALAAVQPELSFSNLGKRYLTMHEIHQTQLGPALELKPDLALVGAGGNDILLERFDPAVTEMEFESIITSLEAVGATVVTGTLFNIFDSGLMPAELTTLLRPKYDALNDAVRNVGQRHDLAFLDYARMPWTADPELYSSDLIHPNRRGHSAGAEATVRCLAEYLESKRSSVKAGQ